MKIYVSPLAGITDYSYRKIIERFNPDLLFTEMVNAHLMKLEDPVTVNELLKCDNFEKTASQVFGSDKSEIIHSFLRLEKIGFKNINLNMGCPQPKIIKSGAGAALLPGHSFIRELLYELKSKLRSSTKISIKIRTGYRDFNEPEIYLDMVDRFQLDFICVHGRTQEQIYSGTADWKRISALSRIPRNIDFIGNGDLFEANEIKKTISESNLNGIMLARGIIGNPWLISQTRELLENGRIDTAPSFPDVKSTLLEHFRLLIENKGEIRASMEINKFIRPYFENTGHYEGSKNPDLTKKLREIVIEKDAQKKMKEISIL